jgi:aminopeptidase N
MIRYFSSLFVEYPYEKYGMVALMPFGFGGMEHMTLTSMNRVWLRTDEQSGIAHELAHQWLGDLITCASWKDIWINEGGASWCEALWAQHEWGKPGYYYTNLYARSLYLSRGGLSLPPIYNQPMYDLFNTALTYKKAGLVYSMLQSMLGDSLYFKTLRGLLTDSAFKSITTDDFKNYFKSHIDNPPVDFDSFFDQWIYHAGHPVYRLNTNLSSTDNNKYKVKVKIDQTQTGINVPDVFVVPLTVTCVSADSIQTFSTQIINNQRSQVTEFEAPFKPSFVTVDTVSVLSELASTVTSVREIAGSENINSEVFPNPAVSGSQCYLDINIASAGNLTAEIYNEIGRKSATIYNGFIEPGNFRLGFDTRDLNAGAYMVRVISGNEVITRRFTVVK